MLEIFFTTLAWIGLVASTLRIVGIVFGTVEHAHLIRLAEAAGGNPIGEALIRPVIVFVVSAAWLVAWWLT